jgi:hypothetical protein
MNDYWVVLFVHVLGTLGIFATFGLDGMRLQPIRSVITFGQVCEWIRISRSAHNVRIASLLTILICGFYMMAMTWEGVALELGLPGGNALLVLGVIATVPGVRSGDQGAIIGWGTGQSAKAVARTRAVTTALTDDKVKEMNAKGLCKEWVESQLKMYRKSIAKGVGSPAKPNTQVFPRQKLMEKILALWP